MILVFGGTTEGRKTVKELDEAGNPFYYSTKRGEQALVMHNGVDINGTMDEDSMTAFCQNYAIRLIIDAAHPFASVLHSTIASVASQLGLPVIRFERVFPKLDETNIIRCTNYEDAVKKILQSEVKSVFVTTGVQSINHLKELEDYGVVCKYRILDRDSSRMEARNQGIHYDKIVYYHDGENDFSVFADLKPDAVLLKESGITGGYEEKINAALLLGIKIFVISRPPVPSTFITVDGEHGLRRMVEKLLPDFYPLHSGLTTGTCATAAAIASALWAVKGVRVDEAPVVLPNGETINVDVHLNADGSASVYKDSGDDPDITRGIEIKAKVEQLDDSSCDGIEIIGGEGIGIITLKGFDYPIGSPAINKVPRQMICHNLRKEFGTDYGFKVTVSVPEGRSIAPRTFNPRLGIVDGISIVGVSGIIKPFSEEGFVKSIRKCMEVAKATNCHCVAINSGAKSERYMKAYVHDLPSQAFVEYGNFIGETIRMAAELGIEKVVLGVMIGKAVKLAAGNLDTHSKKTVMDKSFICSMLIEAGCDLETTDKVKEMTMARELWTLLPNDIIERFSSILISHCQEHCKPLLPDGELEIILFDEKGCVHGA